MKKWNYFILILGVLLLLASCNSNNQTNEDVKYVEQTIEKLNKSFLNPESLQIHEIIIHKVHSDDYRDMGEATITYVYMDISAMNKMGGLSRDYVVTSFVNDDLEEQLVGSDSEGVTVLYATVQKAIEDEEEDVYYYDVDLLDY